MDLIREMLLIVAKNPQMDHLHEFFVEGSPEFAVPGCSQEQLGYHARLLLMSGLVTGDPRKPSISGLTSEDHAFLESIRDTSIWETTKLKLAGLPSVTLKVFASVAQAIDEAAIKKHLGLQ